MKHIALAALALALVAPLNEAQDPPFRAKFRSGFSAGVSFADVWGEGNTALVAHIGQPDVDIVDVTNPDEAVLLTTWSVAFPNSGTSAQDIKSANGLLFTP